MKNRTMKAKADRYEALIDSKIGSLFRYRITVPKYAIHQDIESHQFVLIASWMRPEVMRRVPKSKDSLILFSWEISSSLSTFCTSCDN